MFLQEKINYFRSYFPFFDKYLNIEFTADYSNTGDPSEPIKLALQKNYESMEEKTLQVSLADRKNLDKQLAEGIGVRYFNPDGTERAQAPTEADNKIDTASGLTVFERNYCSDHFLIEKKLTDTDPREIFLVFENTSDIKYKSVTITGNLYDKNEKVIASFTEIVENLKAGGTKEILLSKNYAQAADFKVTTIDLYTEKLLTDRYFVFD